MRCQILWTDVGATHSAVVSDISFSPDGKQLLTGASNRLKIYDTNSGAGTPGRTLAKDVNAVAHAPKSGLTASGDAGGQVTVWSSSSQIVSTFQHALPVIALAFSSFADQLASATSAEYALWSPGDSPVVRQKVPDGIACLAWSHEGSLLAVGTAGARVCMYDSVGARVAQTPCRSAVTAMAWSPTREGEDERLVVGCADGSVSFFSASGSVIGHHVALGSPIAALAPFFSGEFLCVACANGRLSMHSRAGVSLGMIAMVDAKVAHIALQPGGTNICLACLDGSLAMLQLTFLTVHSLYQDLYACREGMTRVAVRDLASGARAAVECGALVQAVALYAGRLAVQLAAQALVYSVPPEGAAQGGLSLHLHARIGAALPCSLLLVAARHLLLCQDQELLLINFEGCQEKCWATKAAIKYARIVSGPPGCESALVGCQDGVGLQVFLAHPQPLQLLQHGSAIRCLDLSRDRSRVALVDEHSCLHVYEAETGAALWRVEGAASAAWNARLPDMLAWCDGETLYTRTGSLPAQRHALILQGAVVGLLGRRVYCLQGSDMHVHDMHLSATIRALVKQDELEQAFEVAGLGAAAREWQVLGEASLLALQPDLAAAAFQRAQDPRMLHAAAYLASKKAQGLSEGCLHAYSLALLGRFREAAEAYGRAGATRDADLMRAVLEQRIDEAAAMVLSSAGNLGPVAPGLQPGSIPSTDQRQTSIASGMRMTEARNGASLSMEYEAAADALLKVGDRRAAVKLLVRHACWQKLMAVSTSLDPGQSGGHIQDLVTELRAAGQLDVAVQILLDIGETEVLEGLLVETERWEEALQLLKGSPQAMQRVLEAYAGWLVAQHRDEDAYKVLREAGGHRQAEALMEDLSGACASHARFSEAATHMLQLAQDAFAADPAGIEAGRGVEQEHAALQRFLECLQWARMYSACAVAHAMQDMESDSAALASRFHALHFLVTQLLKEEASRLPPGINVAEAMVSLAQAAACLGLAHIADAVLNHLQGTGLSLQRQEEAIRLVQAACAEAADEELALLQPACFRCGCSGALDLLQAEQCPECQACYVRSCASFECIPAVEVFLEDGITDEEARQLLGVASHQEEGGPGWEAEGLWPLVMSTECLMRSKPGEIMVDSWEGLPVRARYFRVMDAEFPLRVGRLGPAEGEMTALQVPGLSSTSRGASWVLAAAREA